MNEKIDGRPMKYSVFIVYSEKLCQYFAKRVYYRNRFTKDPTKARMYTQKGHATNSIAQSGLYGEGFAVYERKISASDYKCLTAEDKDKKIRELELELDRLRAEIDTVKRNKGGLTLEQLNEKLRPIMPFHPDRFGPPYT